MDVILGICTILGGFAAVWFFFDKKAENNISKRKSFFKSKLVISVNDVGDCLNDEELAKTLRKATTLSSKNKDYELQVISSQHSLSKDDVGIKKEVDKTVSEKLQLSARALKLLVWLWQNDHLRDFDENEFINMAKGVLRYTTLELYNPNNQPLDVYFRGNMAFRSMIEFSPVELRKLFDGLKINDLFEMTGGSVYSLPRDVLCTKVIPSIVYTLEKHAAESLDIHTYEHFKINLWSYDIA